jgi:type VI secretion system protein VasG
MNLRSLIGRLDDVCRNALEAAAGFCLSRTHYTVEIEHWLIKLLEVEGAEIGAALRRYEIDPGAVKNDFLRAIDRLKSGNARPPALAPALVELAREAWLVASLDFEASTARSGHVLLALLSSESLARQLYESSDRLKQVPVETLRRDLEEIGSGSVEAESADSKPAPGSAPVKAGPGGALDQFTIDRTQIAEEGKIDPVLGRDSEIRQVIDILTRRRQNRPRATRGARIRASPAAAHRPELG